MTSHQERAAATRREKLKAIERQVRDGSLVIRPMTQAERATYPKPTVPRKRRFR